VRLPSFVRQLTDPLLLDLRVPVLSGSNRGRWWSLISAGSGHATGRRTAGQLALLERLLRPGDVMWDVGAHHGFVMLTAARVVGPGGSVWAFEPSALNRAVLERHLSWNDVSNATLLPYALADHKGVESFGGDGTSKTFRLGAGMETVQVRRGDRLIEDGVCPAPSFVKIDVEGAEADALAGLLPALPPTARLLIAMHDRSADARCVELLRAASFELRPSAALVACRNGAWVSDPDLFAYGSTATGVEADLEALRNSGF
jgi:FkbM family methyltransferase